MTFLNMWPSWDLFWDSSGRYQLHGGSILNHPSLVQSQTPEKLPEILALETEIHFIFLPSSAILFWWAHTGSLCRYFPISVISAFFQPFSSESCSGIEFVRISLSAIFGLFNMQGVFNCQIGAPLGLLVCKCCTRSVHPACEQSG